MQQDFNRIHYYSNSDGPWIHQNEIPERAVYEREYLNITPHRIKEIQKFKETFEELIYDIQCSLYKVKTGSNVREIITNCIDIYNGHGDEKDHFLFFLLGYKKKSKRINYNFYLKDYYVDGIYNILKITIVGYVENQEHEKKLAISLEMLEYLRY